MATLKLIIRKQKIKSNGEAPIYIRLTHHRKSQFISTGYSVHEKYWDQKNQRVKPGHQNSSWLNNYLQSKLSKIQQKSLEMETSSSEIQAKDIKQEVFGKTADSFMKYCEDFIEHYEATMRPNTTKRFRAMFKKLKKFQGNKDLLISDLNLSFLKKFDVWLRSAGNHNNTVYTDLRTLRTVCNHAVEEGILKLDKNPFMFYKLKLEKTDKPRLSIEEINKIIALDLKEESTVWHVRNYFLFSFYCAGIRIGDLMRLKVSNIMGDRLKYKMTKTNEFQSVILIPQAKEIMQKYVEGKTQDDFLFPILDTRKNLKNTHILYKEIASKSVLINKCLKKIDKQAEINKSISFHMSRHSFADFARKKGMDLYSISKALRHSNLKITQAYLANFDDELLDKQLQSLFNPVEQQKSL